MRKYFFSFGMYCIDVPKRADWVIRNELLWSDACFVRVWGQGVVEILWWQGLTKNGIFNHEWALFYPNERKQYRFFSNYFFYKSVLFIYYGIKRNAQFSNCKQFLIFPSQFPDIPRKISAYLQANFPSVANTRNISGLCKSLNVNNLYLMGILSFCKKHHFGLQNGPYWRLKSTISHLNIGLIGLRYGQYHNVKRIITDYDTGYIKISQ